jgi:hypothetical protein
MQTCAELGIKLALKEDDNDRLRVAAPKGALTAALRDALAAHKPDLIAILQAKQPASPPTQASTAEQDSAEARVKAEPEARRRAQEEAALRIEEEARFRLEDETLRKAAEELARKRTEAQARLKEQEVRAEAEAGRVAEQICVKAERKARQRPKVLIEGDSVHEEPSKEIETFLAEKGIVSAEDDPGIPSDVLKRLNSPEAGERKAALAEVVRTGSDDAFRHITLAFDDQAADVRNAAARALYDLQSDRAATFTRALREGTPERSRKIGQALASSGLASEAVGNLTRESREKTYDAFSLLFLMAKAGEVQLLMRAIEDYPSLEVRIAVVKILALSGQSEIVAAFRRLAVRGALPSAVRSALMEAIYQFSSQARENAPSAA